MTPRTCGHYTVCRSTEWCWFILQKGHSWSSSRRWPLKWGNSETLTSEYVVRFRQLGGEEVDTWKVVGVKIHVGFTPLCSRDLAQTRWACPSRAPPCAPALVKTRLRYVCREGLGIETGWFGMFWEKWLCSSPSTLNTGGAGLRQVKRPWLCNGFFSTEPLLHPTLDSDKTWITYELPF